MKPSRMTLAKAIAAGEYAPPSLACMMATQGLKREGHNVYVLPKKSGEHPKKVKNLGWLLRHASRHVIDLIEVIPQGGEALLIVTFNDGTRYETKFADYTVLIHFLDRPLFRGADISLAGSRFRIGDAAHKAHIEQAWTVRGNPRRSHR